MPNLVTGAPAALQGVGDSVGGVQGVWGVWGVQGVQGVGDCVQGGIAGRRPLRVFSIIHVADVGWKGVGCLSLNSYGRC